MIHQVESERLPTSFDLLVFLDLSSLDSTHLFPKILPFLMSIGDIDEAYRFWSIVILFFVSLTFSPKNSKVPFLFVPNLNIFLNYDIIFLWNLSFPQNIKSSTCIVRIPIKLLEVSFQRNSTFSYALTIPIRWDNSWLKKLLP